MEENQTEQTEKKLRCQCGPGGCGPKTTGDPSLQGGQSPTRQPPLPTESNASSGGETIDWEKIAKYKAAELENYIKRQKDAVSNAFNEGRGQVLAAVLPVLDNFSDALKMAKPKPDGEAAHQCNESLRTGIEMLKRKFEGILMGLGMEEIPTGRGDPFDPYIHQCVAAGENTDNKVKEIWQKGYRFAGRVIRPVTVKI